MGIFITHTRRCQTGANVQQAIESSLQLLNTALHQLQPEKEQQNLGPEPAHDRDTRKQQNGKDEIITGQFNT